jgi:hypothetical protein
MREVEVGCKVPEGGGMEDGELKWGFIGFAMIVQLEEQKAG